MEKIKVNMNPNPLDVQTIHASQNDGEARQWEFELHNNGEKIDSSSITDQLVFKTYKGGTEQLLPENGSTPTTSPFKGDIKYPQGLLSDQEFLYRESPTEEDGLAKITDIKGNTLVWNQLVYNGNFTSTDGWAGQSGNPTLSVADNSITVTMTSGSPSVFNPAIKPSSLYPFVANHKYLFSFDLKATKAGVCLYLRTYAFGGGLNFFPVLQSANTWTSYKKIVTATNTENVDGYFGLSYGSDSGITVGDSFSLRNLMMFDLTALGIADKTNEEILQWFEDYFPLNYYPYNSGSLIPFNGNGIKTVGFNQWDEDWEEGFITPTSGENTSWSGRIRSKNYIPLLQGERYYFNIKNNTSINNIGLVICYYDANKTYISGSWVGNAGNPYESPANASYMRFATGDGYGSAKYNHDICINISSSENGKYEPYTSSTLSLPISTYFPTGMKSAGSVYDELTPTKAITRIGAVDLGSLNWIHRTEISQGIFSCNVTSSVLYKRQPSVNFEVAKYINGGTVTGVTDMVEKDNMTVCVYHTGNNTDRYIYIKDTSFNDATALKNSLQGVYLYYELATPTETSFTTASLVTENAEIPLSNEDGVLIGKCTEQLSAEPGFHDAKIKLSDGDGECYSNKIQLHVERSPQ